ncbi:transferrin 2 isoform X4 [Bacillus rossius redtenbacheri]|uniref:transferrin 2 isoform X4 n=1 Tax=Bacillus rossius redtenbacheri TaxID=93214 RepID=UPI002FDC82EF
MSLLSYHKLFLVQLCYSLCRGQMSVLQQSESVVWCTIGREEQWKCGNFSQAIERDFALFGSAEMRLQCLQAASKEECMTHLDNEIAHVTSLDAGEVFVGGRYHSLVPIMQELYNDNQRYYYSVAVLRKSANVSNIHSLRDLRGKKACFSGVGTLAGWVIPVHTLMKDGAMEVKDCNNHVKSTINFFAESCAVNSLIDKYNPLGDNSDKLCKLCIGKIPGGRCTQADPYAGFEGAFRCLLEAGDVAFLKHTTVQEMTATSVDFSGVTSADFELLCRDGTRRPVEDYFNCNWGAVPPHAIVTSSAMTVEDRRRYQRFLEKAVQLYGQATFPNFRTSPRPRDPYSPYNGSEQSYAQPNSPQNPPTYESFRLFESSPKYGLRHNLLVQDVATGLLSLDEGRQTFSGYLGASLDLILDVRRCPVGRMTLCVTSDPEMEKCIKMRIALKAQLLKPEMICYKGHSQIHCMQAIKNGDADVAVFDAGDVYTAGLQYDLVPFISEVYNLETPEYYVVAVAKEEDPSTEITYLKGKYTCHTGINTAAGWIIPMAYLISNGWIRSYGCNSVRAAAEYFTKSCVPGALSSEYNTDIPYENMCHLCHGPSYRYCRRDASEDFYGYTGAFRCLVEGGGHVAFVKHTTVMENTDGKRREWWARNTLTDDYELLCPDGTRATVHEYKRCSLGKVKANAIVTRGGYAYNLTEMNAYINLFTYAQQLYGRKDPDEFSFSMFYSVPPYSDLIFQDATQKLEIVAPEQRSYGAYLGGDFMRARRIVDCHAGVASVRLSVAGTLLTAALAVLLGRGVL